MTIFKRKNHHFVIKACAVKSAYFNGRALSGHANIKNQPPQLTLDFCNQDLPDFAHRLSNSA